MTNSHSIWAKLDRYPPILVRLLARKSATEPMTNEDIWHAANGALSRADVQFISFCTKWDYISVGSMKAFCLACGVDFANRETMRSLNRYVRSKPSFAHLRGHAEDPEFQAILNEYVRT